MDFQGPSPGSLVEAKLPSGGAVYPDREAVLAAPLLTEECGPPFKRCLLETWLSSMQAASGSYALSFEGPEHSKIPKR